MQDGTLSPIAVPAVRENALGHSPPPKPGGTPTLAKENAVLPLSSSDGF